GGTTLIDLMKLEVMTPSLLVDLNSLPMRGVEIDDKELRIGALEKMSAVAANPLVATHFPVISEALLQSAAQQPDGAAGDGGSLGGDRLTLYVATQGGVSQRRNVAAVLGVDQDSVRVICPFFGGAFGCKGSMWMFSPLTAAAARALNRPVKTILTREQMFTLVGHRPALIQRLRLGASRDGQLLALKHDV